MSIYVEILIHSHMDDLWKYTQGPDLHERWDLRFSKIEYLPRPDVSLPQQFLYRTRIGFVTTIRGKGESVGEQRFYEGALGFRFPVFFSGVANVCERYDDDIEKYRISVNVANPLWGPLFGYEGAFDVEWKSVRSGEIPVDVKPIREERRA